MRLARIYAEALFSQVQDAGVVLDAFAASCQDPSLRHTLVAGCLASRHKALIVGQAARAAGFPDGITRFLELLARKGRLSLIGDVAQAYRQLALEKAGILVAQVRSAGALSDASLEQIKKRLEEHLGRHVLCDVSVDARLVGGVQVMVAGVTYDLTVQSQLQKMRDCIGIE